MPKSAFHRQAIAKNGKIINELGEIIPEDTTVTLTASAGKFFGADQDNDAPGFQVIAHGSKFTAMQSSLSAQRVEIRAAINASSPTPKEAYTDVEFITNLRPSLATGSVNLRIGASGTNYGGSYRDF